MQDALDSFKPELDIPADRLSPAQFAEVLSELGVVCNEDAIFSYITCTRPDFCGDRYDLRFFREDTDTAPSIELAVTMVKDLEKWRVHQIFDPREPYRLHEWESKPTKTQWLKKMDSSSPIELHEVTYNTADSKMFSGSTVYTITTDEKLEIELSPVELLNAILKAKENGPFNFIILLD